jgi:uncharacterized protein YjbJ (UPF0337 family)
VQDLVPAGPPDQAGGGRELETENDPQSKRRVRGCVVPRPHERWAGAAPIRHCQAVSRFPAGVPILREHNISDIGGVMTNADEAKGRVKRAAGELTDDEKLKREGSVDKAAGAAKRTVDRAADKAKKALDPK